MKEFIKKKLIVLMVASGASMANAMEDQGNSGNSQWTQEYTHKPTPIKVPKGYVIFESALPQPLWVIRHAPDAINIKMPLGNADFPKDAFPSRDMITSDSFIKTDSKGFVFISRPFDKLNDDTFIPKPIATFATQCTQGAFEYQISLLQAHFNEPPLSGSMGGTMEFWTIEDYENRDEYEIEYFTGNS
jgi:hypothetical protein